MGLLDEAIRDHLQLKREHGADPSDLARLEDEALGPPVRETQEALEATRVAPAVADEPPATGGEGAVVPPEAEALPAAADAPPEAPPPAEEPEAEAAPPLAADPRREPPAEPQETPPAEPQHPRPPVPPVAEEPPPGFEAEPAGPPTVAFDAQQAAAEPPPPSGDGEGEDVLEETPEFLQETPEHDRLWFEQKPPRDFDFDG